ncbi:MAG: multifunctional CCA tRNA nucleotidyl transferase/2'3'-cyclic phosphodiesterase/2'nucleotidase/phosphatase [Pseudomonadales bacterium]
MQIYLVGGAVRDQLRGVAVSDRDWLVVGSTPQAMRRAGFRQVGADFPVFLHPHDDEEYALARTERRTGPGHRGFVTDFSPDVTLEEDLKRRDLTVNAMAMTPEGEIIDPYGGREDLRRRLLRAVSPAFSEDPLRVFRVARFAAQLEGFSVVPETLALMREMARGGRLAELAPERVWQELRRAVDTPSPWRFLDVLRDADALLPFFEEWRVEPPLLRHAFRGDACLAAWCEHLDGEAVRSLAQRLRMPNAVRDFVLHVGLAAPLLPRWRDVAAEEIVRLLGRLRAFQDGSALRAVLRYLESRHGVLLAAFEALLDDLAAAPRAIDFPGIEGRALGEAIERARVERVREAQRAR